MGYDTVNLTREPDYYQDAIIRSEYGWVMGTPYPSRVVKFDPVKHSLTFGGQWGDGIGAYHYPRYTRYYLEDKPQYLDDGKSGEFWFDKRGNGGRLYLRLPGDADPNAAHVEVAKRLTLIDSDGMNHIHITGLAMRFTNVWYDLPALPGKNVDVACIRLLGSGSDLLVANCTFEHVHLPIRFKAVGQNDVIDGVVIRDNLIQDTDHGAMVVADGGEWGQAYTPGRLLDVKVLRNRLHEIGHRPTALSARATPSRSNPPSPRKWPATSSIASTGRASSSSAARRTVPLRSPLDPHPHPSQQGGRLALEQQRLGRHRDLAGRAGLRLRQHFRQSRRIQDVGHIDRREKPGQRPLRPRLLYGRGVQTVLLQQHRRGKSKDPFDRLGNTAAFQEIIGYSASIFNNTIYNFLNGSRRQVPVAGRNKYMGNIWQGIGHMVFRHADPKGLPADPNAADAKGEASDYHHASNVYTGNVFYDVPKMLAVFESSGRWHGTLEGFRRALALRGTIGDAGEVAAQPPWRRGEARLPAHGGGPRQGRPRLRALGPLRHRRRVGLLPRRQRPHARARRPFPSRPLLRGPGHVLQEPDLSAADRERARGELRRGTAGGLDPRGAEVQRREPVRRAHAGLAGRLAAAGKGRQDREQAPRDDHASRRRPASPPTGPPKSSCGCTASSRA